SWQQLLLELFLCTVLLSCSVLAMNIIPDYDDESLPYVVQRQPPSERDCMICVTTFDLECRNGQRSSATFYKPKREYSMSRSHPAASNMCGCCAITRLSNNYCCAVCNASKRGG
ncbi:unnamed protein product, partial [Candidula unifasciata]